MKALKTIGIVVAVVGLAATGLGLALPAVAATAGAAATAGGIAGIASAATLASIGAIASITAGVIGVATSVFAPKPSFSQGGNPLDFQTNPQSGLPYAIGRTRMSGLRIHADTYDGLTYKSEGKDDVLSFAVMLSAGGPIESVERFRADKSVVTFDPTTGMAVGAESTWMAQKVSLGLAGASALALAFGGANFPGWTANHKLSGIAHALWGLRYDLKGEHFTAGVPEPEWILKGVKVYDPRKDGTYPGGLGSHRPGDEATYEYSNNGALHALTWALGRWQNSKRTLGLGAPVEHIRISDFIEAANVADANGWTCGGVEWSTDAKWTTFKRMLQSCGAEPTMTGAMIGCRVNAPRVSVATVPGSKLLDGLSKSMTRSRRDRFNTVIPRFRSEGHDWEVISGSPVTHAVWVNEDGGQRTKEIDFPLVQAEEGQPTDGNVQAGQLAAYEIVNSREAGPWRFTVGPEFIGVKTGDCITLDAPSEGVVAQDVIVRRRSFDAASFKITLEVETETVAKHDFALGKTTTPPPLYTPTAPNLTPPTPNAALWNASALLLSSFKFALKVAGACEFPGADTVLVEYREIGAADWTRVGTLDASGAVDLIVDTLAPESSYEARLAYKAGARVGGWLTLGPVNTPALPSANPAFWVLEATGGTLPQLRIFGTPEFPYCDAVLIEYRTTGTGDWTTQGKFDPSKVIDHLINTIEPVTSYEVRIAYQAGAYTSAWTVIGPVTSSILVFPGEFEELQENFDNRNDRIGTPAVVPVVAATGAAVDHTANKNGSIDSSFEWSFPSGEEANHDYFEVMLYSSDVAGTYTPGTALGMEERWLVPITARGTFERGLPADLRYTWAVRSARVVDADIDSDQIIHSPWVKSTRADENPYYPPSLDPLAGDITTTIDGVSASNVALGIVNFNSRNDRNPITPLAPTLPGGGAAIDHIQNDDGSVDSSFEWNWGGIEADNDGFEVEVFTSPTSFAYTPGSSPDALVTRVPIQRRGFIIQGVAANRFYTFAVRTFRAVDPDINATGFLYSAWVKSTVSGENPYQPNANPTSTIDILGTIAGRAATVVSATINADGSIASAKVNENSIIDGAVNLANYTLAGSSFLYTTPGLKTHHFTAATATTTNFGQSILARAGVIYEIRAVDPTPGAAYTVIFNLRLLEWNGTNWINSLVSTDFPVSEVWNEAATTGVMPFGQKVITPEIRFTGLNPSKMFAIGLELTVPSGCNVRIEKIYSRMDLMKKTQ